MNEILPTNKGEQKTETQIFVFSQPIQTGKTTSLQQWIAGKRNIGGILTPDIDGKRMLFDIARQTYFPLQLNDADTGIRIGRFVFSEAAFENGRNILRKSLDQKYDWIIVDEIGRLEMDNQQGLEPVISEVIEYFKTQETDTKLLLVIRDYLLENAKEHYGLNDVTVLTKEFFEREQKYSISNVEKNRHKEIINPTSQISNFNCVGIVLCGGQSVRMGRDKAFISYHQKPQYAFVADMMRSICADVFISCNEQQYVNMLQQYQLVVDNATYADAGPMTGVLSVFEQQKDAAIFVMGCDYPHFKEADMKALFDAREGEYDVVCYHNPETHFDEPLLAIYEKQCASLLLQFYQEGNTSLLQFLKNVRVKRITPSNLKSIQSVDR